MNAEELKNLAAEEYCYLTTTGRVTGKPHEIEIWFGIHESTVYLMSGGGEKSDWVKNLRKNPSVTMKIAGKVFPMTARLETNEEEQSIARHLLADKYHERESDGSLSEWARTALVIGINLKSS